MIRREIHIFFTALMFLTRIPCPKWAGYSEEYLNQASRYFPLVGVVVGSIAALVYWTSNKVFSPYLSILFSMISSIWITGAFHEDGLADFCDGFGGGWTKTDILRIMKDSRIGTYGVVGLCLGLALKYASLQAIPAPVLPAAIIAGHAISRFYSGTFIYSYAYVQEDLQSKVKPLARKMTFCSLVVSGIWCIIPLFFFNEIKTVFLIITPVPIKWLLGRYMKKRLGGYTGDCLGAAQQIFEIVIYLTAGCLVL
jgi:adenosylcobinamide-GDP ribazoletransferase